MVNLDTNIPPRLQRQLISHQSQWQLLQRQFHEKKLHPAWLLSGQKGIGKATFAYQAARYLLKDGQNNDQFFDTLINQNSHPNLLIIEKNVDEDGKLQNEITVESIRKIAEFVHQSAAFPGWRVIIIDAIDDLNRNAANALLKILEEPPGQVLILLVCHSIGRILPTIRSRCCLMPFYGLTNQELIQITQKHPQDLALELANGSIGRLISLQQLDLELLLSEVLDVLQAVFQNKLQPLQQFIADFEKGNPKALVVMELLPYIASQCVLLQSNAATSSINSRVVELANVRPVNHWLFVHERLTKLIQDAEKAHLDLVTLLMAAFLCFESPQLLQELG